MSFDRAMLTCLAGGVLAIAIAAGAAGDSVPGLEFQLGLTDHRPATGTAMTLHVVYENPSDPNAKPSPLRKSVVQAPTGTVFDGHAVAVCTASDSELQASGPSVCPAESQVGTGTVLLITGFGSPIDPLVIDVVLLNGGDGIIELFSDHHNGARLSVGHAKFTAPNTLTETPAPNPGGPPDGESSVHQVDFSFNDLHGPDGRAFITTPPSCPANGQWTSHITATVADGHTYTTTSTTPCQPLTTSAPLPTRAPASPASPAIRLHVSPRHIETGTRVHLHIRLSATLQRCLQGATVRLRGIRAPTGRRGRATLNVRLSHTGLYAITATHRGCRTGRTTIRVRQ